MNKKKLCKLLQDTTYWIKSFPVGVDPRKTESLYHIGSGVCISPQGHLLTAAHLVAELPYDKESLSEEICILAGREKDSNLDNATAYRIKFLGAEATTVSNIKTTMDLALLEPVQINTMSDLPFLRINTIDIDVGTDVLMAGFSGEMVSSTGQYFSSKKSDIPQHVIDRLESRNRLLIKSAMIGAKSGVRICGFTDETKTTVDHDKVLFATDIIYLDNTMHSGASGGLVINMQGYLVGTITQYVPFEISGKIITNELSDNPIVKIDIPSGTCLAVTSNSLVTNDKLGGLKVSSFLLSNSL